MKKRLIITFAAFILLSQSAYSAQPTQEEIQKYNLYYNNGVTYLKNKQYGLSIVEFKKVLRFQPFDPVVKQSLISAYLARAEHYLNNSKDPKKALTDLKSAMFYMRYWAADTNSEQIKNLMASTQTSLAQLQRKVEDNITPAQRLQNARALRAQGELPAAGYDFMVVTNSPQFAKSAYENAGDIFKSLNNSASAIDCYRSALKVDPKDAKLHFKYAVILDEANNFDAAAEEYNLALKYGEKNPELLDILENLWRSRTINNPNDPQAFINMGTVYQMKGDLASAKTQYLKALSIIPNDRTALLNLASLYLKQGDVSSAIAQYNRLLAIKPNDVEVIGYKAAAYENAKDYRNAMAQYRAILAVSPEDADAKNAIAEIVTTKFTPEQKSSYMMLEANSNPQNYDLQYAYAYEMHKQKRYNEAITYYKRSIALNPKKPEAYINAAQIYLQKNDYTNAEAIIEAGIAANPVNAELLTLRENIQKDRVSLLYDKATKLYEAGNFKGALDNYLKISKQTPEVQTAIAGCYFELKDYANSAKYYESALKNDPKNEELLYFAAISYMELKNYAKSLELLEQIVTQNPNNKEALNTIASIKETQNANVLEQAVTLYENKDFQGALNALNKVLAQEPKNAYALYYKGAVLEEQNKLKDANAQYKAAIAADPDFTLAWYSYAVSLDNLEKYQEAVDSYNKFLELKTKEGTSGDEYAKFARSRAKELSDFLNANKK